MMDRLSKALIGRNKCVITIHNEVSKAAVLAVKDVVDLEDHLKRAMVTQLAQKLMEEKAEMLLREDNNDDGNVHFTVKLFAMTEQEINALVLDAYQAGIDSKAV